MRELPEASNDIMGRETVQVVRIEDGSPIASRRSPELAARNAREAHVKALTEARALIAEAARPALETFHLHSTYTTPPKGSPPCAPATPT